MVRLCAQAHHWNRLDDSTPISTSHRPPFDNPLRRQWYRIFFTAIVDKRRLIFCLLPELPVQPFNDVSCIWFSAHLPGMYKMLIRYPHCLPKLFMQAGYFFPHLPLNSTRWLTSLIIIMQSYYPDNESKLRYNSKRWKKSFNKVLHRATYFFNFSHCIYTLIWKGIQTGNARNAYF